MDISEFLSKVQEMRHEYFLDIIAATEDLDIIAATEEEADQKLRIELTPAEPEQDEIQPISAKANWKNWKQALKRLKLEYQLSDQLEYQLTNLPVFGYCQRVYFEGVKTQFLWSLLRTCFINLAEVSRILFMC